MSQPFTVLEQQIHCFRSGRRSCVYLVSADSFLNHHETIGKRYFKATAFAKIEVETIIYTY